jgi:outer membrane immunogenic protein
MKRFTLMASAGLLAAAMVSPSLAADMPRPAYKAPAYIAPFSWTGFYVGINGGYGWGKADLTNAVGTESVTAKGGLIGGTVGYNFQTGTWVWGLEGDIDYSWIKGTNTDPKTFCAFGCEFTNDWFGTARGRIGYAWDRWLPYLTGGLAVAHVKVGPTGGPDDTKTQLGWTIGGGVEWAFSGAWSAKLEYLYADLGKMTCGAANCGLDTDVKYKTNLVRLGVNYRF